MILVKAYAVMIGVTSAALLVWFVSGALRIAGIRRKGQ